MRYITWRLKWVDGYGYGPEQAVADVGSRLEASSWVYTNVEQGTILGYLYGEYPIDLISSWDAVELSQNDALEFAWRIDESAFVDDDGLIVSLKLIDISGGV